MNSSDEASVLQIANEHKILKDIQSMRNNKKLNDVQIILDDGVVECNKFILSARSEYFEKMLDIESNFREASTGKVKIEGLKKSVMKVVVDFFYSGKIVMGDSFSLMDKLELLDVSRMMMLENENVYTDLMEEIINEIKNERYSVKTCISALQIVDILKLDDSFMGALTTYLNNNDHHISTECEDYIRKMSKNDFLRLLFMKNLSQECVLTFLWVRDEDTDDHDDVNFLEPGKKICDEFNITEKNRIAKLFNLHTLDFHSLSFWGNSIMRALFSDLEIQGAIIERYDQLKNEIKLLKDENFALKNERKENRYKDLVHQIRNEESLEVELNTEDEDGIEDVDVDEDNPFDPNNQNAAE